MIVPISAMSAASPGITVIISPDYLLDGLTAGYVLLTLALAFIAFRSLRKTQTSLDLTRQQIELNKQQSQDASAANAKHTQATIATVNKQIEASERQAQEALYNQHRPVLVPIGGLEKIIDSSAAKPYIRWGNANQEIDGLRNVGVGSAFNIYGILFGSPVNATPPQSRYVVWNYPPLPPGEAGTKITLGQFTHVTSKTTIGGYPLYVPDDVDHLGILARFTLTYHDVSNGKYASIYDYHNLTGWRCRGHFPNIEFDLYELERQTPGSQETSQFIHRLGKIAQP